MTQERNRRIAWSAGIGALQRGLQLLCALIILPLALRHLGVEGFGLWGAATSLVWLTGMLDIGLGSALITLISEAVANARPDLVTTHVTAALVAGTIIAAGIILTIAAAIAAQVGVSAPFVIAGVGLALNVPLSTASNIWFGLQRGYIAASWDCGQALLTLALVVGAVALRGGVTMLVGAVFLSMLTANACSLIHAFVSQRITRPRWPPSWSGIRAVAQPGMLLFGISVASASAYVFDTLLALHWLGPTAAAQMTIALRIGTTATALLVVMTQPLWAAFVDAARHDDREWELRTLRRGTLLVAAAAAAGGAALILAGPRWLNLLMHTDLQLSVQFFWATAAWIFFLSVPRVASLLFNAVGILRFQLAVFGCSSVLAFAIKPFVATQFGVSAILASAPMASLLVVIPAFAWRARRWISRPARASTLMTPGF